MNYRVRMLISFVLLAGLLIYILTPVGLSGKEALRNVDTPFEQIKQYLQDHNFNVVYEDEEEKFVFIKMGGGYMQESFTIVHCAMDDSLVVIGCNLPGTILPEYFSSVSVHLMQLNMYLDKGNFELDTAEGQVYFQSSIPLRMVGLKDPTLESEILLSFETMTTEAPGILKIIGITVADSSYCTEEEIG